MNCDDVRERFSDLIDGLASPGDAAVVEAHLDSCDSCSALLARTRAVVAALAGLAEPAPDHLADRILARVPSARPSAHPPVRPTAAARMSRADLRRVAGWGLVLVGLGWQLGGGALAARAMTSAAPVIAEARETVERTRREGIAGEVESTGEGLLGFARGMRSAHRMMNAPDDVRPGT